jgi:hypothetical protein
MDEVTALAVALSLAALAAHAPSGPASVTLTVRYSDGSAAEHVAHLRCRRDSARADGFLSDVGARAACRHARKSAAFLAARASATRICTQIYGGPQHARITGTIGARRIDRRFARTDGCAIGDWTRAVPLVPRVRAGREP